MSKLEPHTTGDVLRLLSRTCAVLDHMLARIDRRPTLDPWAIFRLKKAVGQLRTLTNTRTGR